MGQLVSQSGVGEKTSRDRRSSLLAGTARRFATGIQRTHQARLPARRGCRLFPRTPCGIWPLRSFSTSGEPTCDVQALLGHITSIPSGCAQSWETSGWTRKLFFCLMSQVRPKEEKEIAAKAVVQLLFSGLLRYREFVACQS